MPDGAVLEQRLVGDRRGGPDGDLDGRLVAAARPGPRRSRSRKIQASAVCSSSNSLTWISPWRAVDFQWIRLKRRPGRTAGRSSRAAWSGASARAPRGCPRCSRPAGATAAAARPAGRRRRSTPWPTEADASKNPNGSPVRIWSGSIRKWPRRVSGARTSHDRSAARAERDRPARQPAGQRRRVVDLEPGLRDAARVAQRVGDLEPVADVAGQLVDRVAGLEVGQAEAGQDVRAADDEDRRGRRGRRGTSQPVENAAIRRIAAMTSSWRRRIIGSARRRASVGSRRSSPIRRSPRSASAGVIARGPFGPPVGRMPSIGRRVEQLADDAARTGRRGSTSSS